MIPTTNGQHYYLSPAFLWLVRKIKELIMNSRGEVIIVITWDGKRFYVGQVAPKGISADEQQQPA